MKKTGTITSEEGSLKQMVLLQDTISSGVLREHWVQETKGHSPPWKNHWKITQKEGATTVDAGVWHLEGKTWGVISHFFSAYHHLDTAELTAQKLCNNFFLLVVVLNTALSI